MKATKRRPVSCNANNNAGIMESNSIGLEEDKDSYQRIQPGKKGDPFLKFRYAKHACLVGTWILMGMQLEIIGPTLPDLRHKLGVNYEEITRAIIGKGVGMLIGSVIGGYLHERFHHVTDALMLASQLLAAAGIGCVPWCPSVPLMGLAFGLVGVSTGLTNTGGNTMAMDLWEDASASPMQLLHFGFGAGALLVPQIARPFLRHASADWGDDAEGAGNVTLVPGGLLEQAEADHTRFEMVYIIVSILTVAFSLVWLFFCIRGYPSGYRVRPNATNSSNLLSPGSCADGNINYGLSLLVCLFFFFFQAVGGEGAMGKFLYSFAIDGDLKMSRNQASTLQTAFWLSHTLGRLFGFVVARFVSVQTMIISDVVGCFLSSLTLAISSSQQNVLWVFSCFSGLFLSLTFPSGMSWANIYLTMNSMGVMVNMVGGSFGAVAYEYLTGFLFESAGPQALFYVMVGHAILLATVYIIMQSIANTKGPKLAEYVVDADGQMDGGIEMERF